MLGATASFLHWNFGSQKKFREMDAEWEWAVFYG
jgi:hypothetical protein